VKSKTSFSAGFNVAICCQPLATSKPAEILEKTPIVANVAGGRDLKKEEEEEILKIFGFDDPDDSKLIIPATLATLATNPDLARVSADLNVATGWQQVATSKRAVFLDFETLNHAEVDLTKVGHTRYAEDPATDIVSVTFYGPDDFDTPAIWYPGFLGECRLAEYAADPAITFASFGDFDAAIWNNVMVRRYGLPAIPLECWENTQATCLYYALPDSLEKVLAALGAPIEKDKEGRKLVLSLSKKEKKTGEYPPIPPEIRNRAVAYNLIDTDGLVFIRSKIGTLPDRERRLWELDQKINARGLLIDVEFARAGKAMTEALRVPLFEEFARLTDGISPTEVEKTRQWAMRCGFTLPSLDADAVAEALEEMSLPDDVRRVLEIRQITAPASLAKFDAMLACVNSDGRARGLFRYHKAHTGRWAGTLIQPQNLPRPTVEISPGEIEDVVAAVKRGDPAELERWGAPIDVLTSSLRFALTAERGKRLGCGDYESIETVILLALAGQTDKLQLIIDGQDVYRSMAATIFGLDPDEFMQIPKDALTIEQSEQRRIGKNTILGCGYGLGPKAFRERYCKHMAGEEADAFAKETVYTHYRESWAPKVRELWWSLGRAARTAMLQPGQIVTADCGIAYRYHKDANPPCLGCRLPNGKILWYQDARVHPTKLDRFNWPIWTYRGMRKGQWREIEPYGGQLTENVVSAIGRELLADSLLLFDQSTFDIVAHCHDELMIEDDIIYPELVIEIMQERSRWAIDLGIPVMVKAWVGSRYRK
jgi:DNA polymerase